MKCLVTFDLEFDLKFEISDGKNQVKFLGRTFLPARKAREISERISGQISEQISEKISETSSHISRIFFGKFVQQKGGAHKRASKLCLLARWRTLQPEIIAKFLSENIISCN